MCVCVCVGGESNTKLINGNLETACMREKERESTRLISERVCVQEPPLCATVLPQKRSAVKLMLGERRKLVCVGGESNIRLINGNSMHGREGEGEYQIN